MSTAILLENVSKKFTIHHQKNRSFQDVVVNIFRQNGEREEFWALKHINLAVQRGETIGIIGENGSGKSTLLKLITRILDPTAGKITVSGRVSALLELGAGFHPDLTGRENIYLNGSILGIGRSEMRRKFNEILDFSELERFIDTPIKHYSSGMYMRLGFSVAISVDPDILIIDEVLAVGDEAFQDKCLMKILDMKRNGMTIVLVSHALSTVERLCSRAVWLDHGEIRSEGKAGKVVADYLDLVAERDEAQRKREHKQLESRLAGENSVSRHGTRDVEITRVELLDATGTPKHVFRTGEDLRIRLTYTVHKPPNNPTFAVGIHREDGVYVHSTNTGAWHSGLMLQPGEGIVELVYDSLPLLRGSYLLTVAVFEGGNWRLPYDTHTQAYRFSVRPDTGFDGVVHLSHRWEIPQRASAKNA